MCEEFYDEFRKLSKVLDEDDKKYFKEADIYFLSSSLPGRGYYRWKKTEKATFYRKYEHSLVATRWGLFGIVNEMQWKENKKSIAISGLNGLYDKCQLEKNKKVE